LREDSVVVQSTGQQHDSAWVPGDGQLCVTVVTPSLTQSRTGHPLLRRVQSDAIPRSHDRANIEQTSSKCIQNARANCSTSARCLLAFIQLARRAMVISVLIIRAGGF